MSLPLVAHGLHWVWHRPTHFHRKQKVAEEERNVVGKIVIITGANHGIGKETALALAQRGAHVVMACRNLDRAQIARQQLLLEVPRANIDLLKLDLADLSSVREFAAEVHERFTHVDMLINNAGIYKWDDELTKTKDGFESHMGINHLGPFLLTLLLLDLLNKREGSRIISVTSSLFKFASLDVDNLNLKNVTDLGPQNIIPYANSKLANILFIRELVNRLGSCRISAYAVCPGMVYTDDVEREPWYKRAVIHAACRWAIFDTKEGCGSILYCALSEILGHQTGKMYRLLGEYPVDHLVSDDQGYRLWIRSEELVNQKFVKPRNCLMDDGGHSPEKSSHQCTDNTLCTCRSFVGTNKA